MIFMNWLIIGYVKPRVWKIIDVNDEYNVCKVVFYVRNMLN